MARGLPSWEAFCDVDALASQLFGDFLPDVGHEIGAEGILRRPRLPSGVFPSQFAGS